MAIKKTGYLNLEDLANEFGRKNSEFLNFDDYYRGNGLVPNTLRNQSISVYGEPLSLDMFYNTSQYTGQVKITVHNANLNGTKGSITINGVGSSIVWRFCVQPANHYIVAIPNKENIVTWNTGALDVGWHLVGVQDETDWSYYACCVAEGCNESYILGKEHSTTDWFAKASPTELMIKL